ncbi:right-handed parallel beta-helix repeat-containing protein [Streptomyces sp. FXJ1.172]|nr:pectate lyase [Streptomyces sp. FXJ1.172]WEO93649.1 right-handed parallel beta-helix repeat-containing protein [Streptomyces sp. FXJ1.172]
MTHTWRLSNVAGTLAAFSGTTAQAATTASEAAAASVLYVSPSGTDGAAGTQSAPTTLTSAISRIAAGGTIYLRGGTYNYSSTVTIPAGSNGTAGARTTLSAYPGETPVLNFSAQSESSSNRGIQLNADYWHLNRDTGLQLGRIASSTPSSQWPSNNLIVSSESHDNMGSTGENADGFASKFTTGTGNAFRYDVSHNSIDDGWDLYTKTDTGAIGPVTIEYSLSYGNGTLTDGTTNVNGDRNGYKLGGDDIAVDHIVRHEIAYKNGHHGFTCNSNPGTMTVSSNVSIDNTERNFSFDKGTSVFRSDTSCRFSASGSNDKISGDSDRSDQFYSGTNGSRCSAYSGALGWSFASDGHLVVTFGGKVVTP